MIGKDYPDPWDDSDGAALLDDLHATLLRYVVFPDAHAAVAVALWIVATHAVSAFQHAPRLGIKSPQKRCGKSRLLDIIAGTCHQPLMSINATVPAIFRSIGGEHPPTLIIDEADTLFGTKRAAEQNEDLRALLNAGHQRGRPALRCVGPSQIPTEFSTFAMAALAGIGDLPDTITDRAVNITMRRRTPGERVSQFRTRRDGPVLEALQTRLAAWAIGQLPTLTDAEPELPVEDRAADTWEPLVAVADAAGGPWPQLARAACKALAEGAADDDEEGSAGTRLLADIKRVFIAKGASFLASSDLVTALRALEESPWNDYEFNARKLAERVRQYGVRPGRDTTGTVRGYSLESLEDAFRRYTRQDPSDPSETSADQGKAFDTNSASDTSIRQTPNIRQDETPAETPFLTDLTGLDAPPAEIGSNPELEVAPKAFTPPTGPGRCPACGFDVATMGHRPGCAEVERVFGVVARRINRHGPQLWKQIQPAVDGKGNDRKTLAASWAGWLAAGRIVQVDGGDGLPRYTLGGSQ